MSWLFWPIVGGVLGYNTSELIEAHYGHAGAVTAAFAFLGIVWFFWARSRD